MQWLASTQCVTWCKSIQLFITDELLLPYRRLRSMPENFWQEFWNSDALNFRETHFGEWFFLLRSKSKVKATTPKFRQLASFLNRLQVWNSVNLLKFIGCIGMLRKCLKFIIWARPGLYYFWNSFFEVMFRALNDSLSSGCSSGTERYCDGNMFCSNRQIV